MHLDTQESQIHTFIPGLSPKFPGHISSCLCLVSASPSSALPPGFLISINIPPLCQTQNIGDSFSLSAHIQFIKLDSNFQTHHLSPLPLPPSRPKQPPLSTYITAIVLHLDSLIPFSLLNGQVSREQPECSS